MYSVFWLNFLCGLYFLSFLSSSIPYVWLNFLCGLYFMVLDFLLCHLVGLIFIIWFILWPILYSMFHYIHTVVVYILGKNED